MSNAELSLRLFLQLAIILATCRLVGFLISKLGQPQVVGEMIAGVLLGPSLFGLLLPSLQNQAFPHASMSILYAVSQVGLLLYMFLVGTEFDISLLKQRMRSVISVSLAGILAPMLLGGLFAFFLVNTTSLGLFSNNITTPEAMLFLGASVSITAFPMLARIIYERGLSGTSLGTLALAAGSVNDVIAWCILAVVIAIFRQNPLIALEALAGGVCFALVVLFLVRPLLRPLARHVEQRKSMSGLLLTFILILVMLAGWTTDSIGIYAVFGGFLLGVAMPRGAFVKQLQSVLEPITTNFLLPLFFVYSGLNTQIGLINTLPLWIVTLLILLVASLGKGVACWLAARLNGENQREALAIGSLMNARGLMELIILNIGREQGIISPTLFTIMVIMAIVTTLATSPLFEWVYRGIPRQIPASTSSQPELEGQQSVT